MGLAGRLQRDALEFVGVRYAYVPQRREACLLYLLSLFEARLWLKQLRMLKCYSINR
jgi:hypothetical protein